MAKIVFNGKEYSSLEALPPEAREALKHAASAMGDTNKDGIPDALQGSGAPQRVEISHAVVKRSIDVNLNAGGADGGLSFHLDLPRGVWLLISAAAGAIAVYFLLG